VLKIAQLASNRQVYQEVDMKDSALAATSKQCEDCKERDFRLKVLCSIGIEYILCITFLVVGAYVKMISLM